MTNNRANIVTFVLVALVAIELVALVEEMLIPYYDVQTSAGFLQVANPIFSTLAPFSPGLFLLLLYVSPVRFLFTQASNHYDPFLRIRKWFVGSLSPIVSRLSFTANALGPLSSSLALVVFLFIAMTCATLLAYTPYRPEFSTLGMWVGVDTPQYATSVDVMLRSNLGDVLHYAFQVGWSGSRPIPLLLIYTLASAVGGEGEAGVRLVPLVLAPLLVISSFLLALSGLRDRKLAVLAGFLTGASYQVTVGVWASYFRFL